MAAEGRTVIFISHKLNEVKAVADRITILRGGRRVATLPTAEAEPRELAALMVGRDVELVGRREPAGDLRGAEVALELEELWVEGDRGGPAVKGVSLAVRAGEILGVAGVAGNGQRELAEAVTGIRAANGGRVRVAGAVLRPGDPRAAIAAGIAHVPEDRLRTAVAPDLSIGANAVLKSYRGPEVSRGPLLRRRIIAKRAWELIRRYDVKATGPGLPARNLSGGNLQKLVLGREFSGSPRVLIAASPTHGLDVGAIETVHGELRSAARQGLAILLISEDLDEIEALADRIAVIYEGEVVGEVEAVESSRDEIGFLMAGGRRP
jgi:simple sugar transport system ATP-binding protein